jgi:hypothetical protein
MFARSKLAFSAFYVLTELIFVTKENVIVGDSQKYIFVFLATLHASICNKFFHVQKFSKDNRNIL